MGTDGRKNPAMLWYGFDFYSDEAVKLMSYEQQGIYMRLLWHAWHEGSIPEDHADIAELLGIKRSRFNTVWPRIAVKWHPARLGRLLNRRQERERKRLADRTKRLSDAGADGNKKRWDDEVLRSGGDRQAIPETSPGDAENIARRSLPSPSPSPCPTQRSTSESGTGPEPVSEGQGGQAGPALGEVLGRMLIRETKILDRSPEREVVLLGVGQQCAGKGLRQESLQSLMTLAKTKDRPSGWLRWVLENNRWNDELGLAREAS